MEAIVKKWDIYSLIWISDKEWELEIVEKNYDEVIVDFIISDIDRKNIYNWASFSLIDWDIIVSETPESLENIKQDKIREIENEFQETLKQFTTWYSQAEIDSWKTKEDEALMVNSGVSSEFITTLCVEWETEDELATKILTNAKVFKLAYAKAEQIKREKLKALNI